MECSARVLQAAGCECEVRDEALGGVCVGEGSGQGQRVNRGGKGRGSGCCLIFLKVCMFLGVLK